MELNPLGSKYFFGSVARISDLEKGFEIRALERSHWEATDYVVGQVLSSPNQLSLVELKCGRLANILPGDRIVGALGDRSATLEATGTWTKIDDDGEMDQLTPAGLFGKLTSVSSYLGSLPKLRYLGHACRGGTKLSMGQFVDKLPEQELKLPTVLFIGSSMSAGKTTAARIAVRLLSRAGHSVLGAKLTGAGRYRDVLSMRDAGACEIFDFVDAGLPSTVVSEEVFRPALRQLFARFAQSRTQVLVAEAGASPLEAYNGEAAIEELWSQVKLTVLCACDPYSVVGIIKAFGRSPDMVAGPAASTKAGVDLVHKLTGIRALDVLDPEAQKEFAQLLSERLGLEATAY